MLLKKLNIISLSGLYLLFSIGLGLNTHYCAGELESFSFYLTESSCGCGDEVNEMSCCANESRFYQLSDEQQLIGTISANFDQDGHDLLNGNQSNELNIDSRAIEFGKTISERAPPKVVKSYLLFHSLIFYG